MLLGVVHIGVYARFPGSSCSAQHEAPLLGSLCSPLPAELVETLPGVHLCPLAFPSLSQVTLPGTAPLPLTSHYLLSRETNL